MASDDASNKNWAVPADWAAVEPIISRLYRDENKKLAEVMAYMEEKHNFAATFVFHTKMGRAEVRVTNALQDAHVQEEDPGLGS